jgi:hypothetical protein
MNNVESLFVYLTPLKKLSLTSLNQVIKFFYGGYQGVIFLLCNVY